MRVAWLAVALGLAMEGLLLLLAAGFGEALGLKALVADVIRNVTWSVFVCVGLAVGTTISRIQVPAMGLFGLLAAPLAFEVSRTVHKGTLQALAVSGAEGAAASPVLLAFVKGVEYGCLGLLVGWLGNRSWGGALAHVGVGLAVGLVFGGTILALTLGASPGPVPTADLLSQGLNELLFPVGCSLVLFSAGALGRRMPPQGSRAAS
ncbi:hypothetical protein GBA63_06500 [Rubrobacter tropicus]|uniref:Uncharacterized protein n=1 Tax=Rubrobacter tropicus TaxID=2653851 RepID=A0A6G8Q7C2_9ACTN|nr:hypothetical protein [Rubrobacter tropicus]QIN82339.1 hypothetical protein GBA63_06500 [Rubrobacter tropicus]